MSHARLLVRYLLPISLILLILGGLALFFYHKRPPSAPLPVKEAVLKTPLPDDTVTLYLKNGAAISGKLIREDRDSYTILYEGGEVVFTAAEVERMERGIMGEKKEGLIFDEALPERWPYINDIVIKLANGIIVDSMITDADKLRVVVKSPVDGGGSIEQEIPREKIEYLIFRPVDNPQTKNIGEGLKRLFPKMRFYEEGDITIVTDSYITWVREFQKTLRGVYKDIYLMDFGLVKDKKPAVQNFVVIFDDYEDYMEYAAADGIPGWATLGYFDPAGRVLYLFNSLGDKTSDFVFKTLIGEPAKRVDEDVKTLKGYAGSKYELYIEGLGEEVKDKLWRHYNLIKGRFHEQTVVTLRHEFTHEIFHNYNLQDVGLSQKGYGDRALLVDKKKRFLETEDPKEKKMYLMELLGLKSEERTEELLASNSWLAEGTAAYFEMDPPGSISERWLFTFQKMRKGNGVYPLEQLTVYKMGSFPGVYTEAMLNAYAESWAFVTFLMDRYPEQFIEYQKRISNEAAKGQDDINWLLAALGKDLKGLEKEFLEYMDRYEELEDPFIRDFEKFYNIFKES